MKSVLQVDELQEYAYCSHTNFNKRFTPRLQDYKVTRFQKIFTQDFRFENIESGEEIKENGFSKFKIL